MTVATVLTEDVGLECIGERKLIVHQVEYDPDTAWNLVETEKPKWFAKLGFLKPAPDEIICESLHLVYEPFIIMKAHYFLDYYKPTLYTIKIGDEVGEVVIFGHTLQPEMISTRRFLGRPHKAIAFDAYERVGHTVSSSLALTRMGQQIDPQQLPVGIPEVEPEKRLKQHRDHVHTLKISHEEIMERIYQQTAIRPLDVGEIINEVYEVTEYTIICTPIYEARCRQVKTGDIKIIPLSSVTGTRLSI
ncbi:MAG: hypothetical protein NWE83_13565 [Candidatus Bathyarchaeota archaeon]|nr:hypothetical protein [Candidatus Bathyarchaeota archaeon]